MYGLMVGKAFRVSKDILETREVYFRSKRLYFKELICHGKSCCLRIGNQVYWFPRGE